MVNTRCANDREIWTFAATGGFAVVTKDDDFKELAVLRGAPPKLIMIGLGNCSTDDVVALLRDRRFDLEAFERDKVGAVIDLP